MEGIDVYRYGTHIFHTNNKTVWNYVNRFVIFNRFTNSLVANYKSEYRYYDMDAVIASALDCAERERNR